MPASEDRAEHVSLLRWQLDPASARTARVTKQSPVPVTAFLTCAALFFTACVGVLVVGARPAVPGEVLPLSSLQSRRDASAAGERALMESLRFDERWYDQGNTLDAIKIDPQREGRERNVAGGFPHAARVRGVRGAPFWQHFREIPVGFNRPAKTMRDERAGGGRARHRPRRRAAVAEQPAAARAAGGDVRGGHVVARRRGQEQMGLKAALVILRGLGEERAREGRDQSRGQSEPRGSRRAARVRDAIR